MFRLLKLHPPHGWRAVLWELLIVSLGVLIALAAGQAVETWNWQSKSRAAEAEIRLELLEATVIADERLGMSPCFERKLDQLQRDVMAADGPLASPMHRSRYWTIVRFWPTDAWETARAGDVLAHMPADRVREYAPIYRQIEVIRNNLALEQDAIADLALLTWFTGRLSEPTRDRLLAAAAQARRRNEMIIRDARQVIDATKALGIILKTEERASLTACGSLNEPMTV